MNFFGPRMVSYTNGADVACPGDGVMVCFLSTFWASPAFFGLCSKLRYVNSESSTQQSLLVI